MKLFFTLLLCLSLNLHASVESIVEQIKLRSDMSQSDSLVVLHQCKALIVHSNEGCAGIDSMEMTKPLIGLAIALLLDEGRLPCIDMPVHTYYPLWNFDPFNKITLRHLLSDTAGLDCARSHRITNTPIDDILDSTLFFMPGTRYYKNPKTIQLLSDIVKKASGKELFQYLYDRLFEPLGIYEVSWRTGGRTDSLPQFHMSVWDLAKIGGLIANEGVYDGKQLISKRWLNELFMPSQSFDPFFGWQWHLEFYDVAAWWDNNLIALYGQHCLSPEIITHLKSLEGCVIHFPGQVCGKNNVKLLDQNPCARFEEGRLMNQLIEETRCKGLPLARFTTGKLKTISLHGQGGQQFIIMPQYGIVAVRQKRFNPCTHSENQDFDDLPELLEELGKAFNVY